MFAQNQFPDISGPIRSTSTSLESMNVGSPSHSSPQFLPEYLLGDPSFSANSPMHSNRLWSPGLGEPAYSPPKRTHLMASTSTPVMDNLNSNLTIPLGRQLNSTPVNRFGRPALGEKHGGPPVQGLYDPNQTPSQTSALCGGTPVREVSSVNDRSLFNNQSILATNHLSPAQLDPFYTQGESLKPDDELDETWVTVFGFPPSAVSYILEQFSQYGTILEHKVSGSSNWMHLHYQSKIQAKKALGKNGKIFCNNMMIGVQPCIDKKVMNESAKENVSVYNSPLSFTPDSSLLMKSASNKSLGSIRPLTQAYRTSASDHTVSVSARTPQKRTNVVSKAMEYVFGW